VKALLRGSDLVGLPVVTLGGDDVAEVREVAFDGRAGQVLGFTLNKRGFLRGRRKDVLPMARVRGVGPDAVMVPDPAALDGDGDLAGDQGAHDGTGDVLGAAVVTDAGQRVGTVTDVVVDLDPSPHIVGYEVEPAGELAGRHGRHSYIPVPDTVAISTEALVVPAAAADYVCADLAGFAEAVDRYRAALRGGRS
jgi:uncharacterized protein YrrD